MSNRPKISLDTAPRARVDQHLVGLPRIAPRVALSPGWMTAECPETTDPARCDQNGNCKYKNHSLPGRPLLERHTKRGGTRYGGNNGKNNARGD